MAVIASYNFAGYPFDNLCGEWLLVMKGSKRQHTHPFLPSYLTRPNQNKEGDSLDVGYLGTFLPKTAGTQRTVNATVVAEDNSFHYCLQDMFRTAGPSFPAIPENQPPGEEWMGNVQANVVTVAGWTSVAVIAFVGCSLIWGWLQGVKTLFVRPTEVSAVP